MILNCSAVTTIEKIVPCHDGFIRQDRSKSTVCGMNLPNIPQLILDCSALTTRVNRTPCNNPVTPHAPQSKCTPRCSCHWLRCNGSNVASIPYPSRTVFQKSVALPFSRHSTIHLDSSQPQHQRTVHLAKRPKLSRYQSLGWQPCAFYHAPWHTDC